MSYNDRHYSHRVYSCFAHDPSLHTLLQMRCGAFTMSIITKLVPVETALKGVRDMWLNKFDAGGLVGSVEEKIEAFLNHYGKLGL